MPEKPINSNNPPAKRIILWYRNDLRLHDHDPLHEALKAKAQIIPLYCFDPRQFGQTSFGFPKNGNFRAQLLLESVYPRSQEEPGNERSEAPPRLPRLPRFNSGEAHYNL